MDLAKTILKLLSFKITRAEMLKFNRNYLIAGIIGTWIVGMGRYWDDSSSSLLQHLGLGSVIYIFALAVLIWLIIKPFKISNWDYFTVLTFISLTSFPAIFYAIPVEKFFIIEQANVINVWFLALVAAWRLALLYYFLKHFTQLSKGTIVTVTLLPMCSIISTLAALNLHKVVFDIMGGVNRSNPHGASYMVLMVLTVVSIFLTLPLLIAYGFGIYDRRKAIEDETPTLNSKL